MFDAVVYTVGAQTDRRLEIPGEDLPGSWPATQFVAWYNGHPDFQHLEFDLSSERAVVIGNGNVAIDVARLLARTGEELAPTDATHRSIEAIVASGIREIQMLGRRGPAQAAFTPPELKELGELAGADVIVDPADLVLDAASEAALEGDRSRTQRNVEYLREFAARAPEGKPKRLLLRFCVSPMQILGEGRVEAIEVVRNELVADEDGSIRAVPTEEVEVIPCGLVLRSVGYRGVALAGVPFHEGRGVIPNDRGRVLGPDGEAQRGVYAAGWIKRGPSGVIGTNKKDAAETVERLLEDAQAGRLSHDDDAPGPRGPADGARRALRRVRGAGRRSTRTRRRLGRAARQAARQARDVGRAARARPREQLVGPTQAGQGGSAAATCRSAPARRSDEPVRSVQIVRARDTQPNSASTPARP